MEGVIKDIYARKATFASVEAQVEKCLAVDTNQEKFYEFINSVIRDEVEVPLSPPRPSANKLAATCWCSPPPVPPAAVLADTTRMVVMPLLSN